MKTLRFASTCAAALVCLIGMMVAAQPVAAQPFPSPFLTNTLDGTDGILIQQLDSNALFGSNTTGIGDINGDGLDDFAIVFPAFANARVHVIFGTTKDFGNPLDSLNGVQGFTLINSTDPEQPLGGLSSALSAAGDVNGDGYDDLLVGAPHFFETPITYIVYGRAEFPATFDLGEPLGSQGIVLPGGGSSAAGGTAGASVSGIGDLNADGYADIAIGAPLFSSTGMAYVVFGGEQLPDTLFLTTLNGDNGFRLQPAGGNVSLGASVSGAGDFNADGYDDLLVGDPDASSGAGQVSLIYGRATFQETFSVSLANLNGIGGFRIIGTQGDIPGIISGSDLGAVTAVAGDINADGYDDIILSEPNKEVDDSIRVGRVYVLFGRQGIFLTDDPWYDLDDLDTTHGFFVDGIYQGDQLGRDVAGIGDLNGDSYNDVVFGAPSRGSPTFDRPGRAYVLYGRSGGFELSYNDADFDGTEGFYLTNEYIGSRFGTSVGEAGDVNGDGVADLLISDPSRINLITTEGARSEVYLVFGRLITSLGGSTAAGHAALSVWPNPTGGRFTVGLPVGVRATPTLYDLLGRRQPVAFRRDGPQRYAADVAALPPGVYLLRAGAHAARLVVR